MRFTFVDRVLELQPGLKISTVKCLTLAEEYLADHFPRFPVMPGVLMLEAMAEASAWLIRATEDFAHSVVTLKEARNVRFADFVQPGDTLCVTAALVEFGKREAQLKTQGTVAGRVAVSGRLILERYNLVDSRPDLALTDAYLRQYLKSHFALLYQANDELSANGSSAMIPSLSSTPEPSQGQV